MFPFSALLLVRSVAEIQSVCFVNIEFRECKKLILNQVKRASHFVKIIVACPHRLPKLPESTKRKQAIPNKGSLFYSHCGHADESLWQNHFGYLFPVYFLSSLASEKTMHHANCN
jgi:hypothetical protein